MKFKNKKVFVTGADGFIGSHLVEDLLNQGAFVTAMALYSGNDTLGWLEDLQDASHPNLKIVRGDIRDPFFLNDEMKDTDICLHLAALIGIPYSYAAPKSYADVNVLGTLNVLEAARKNNVTRVIHTSTSEIYGSALYVPIDEQHPIQAQSPYSASKIGADAMVESYVRSFEFPAIIFRPFNTFGPRQSERAVISTIIRQTLDPDQSSLFLGDLSTKRDFTYVKDTVNGFLELATSDHAQFGEVYNGGTGSYVSIKEICAKVFQIVGYEKEIVTSSERLRPKDSEVSALLANNVKLKSTTDWDAHYSLEAGLQETINWWQSRIKTGKVRTSKSFLT